MSAFRMIMAQQLKNMANELERMNTMSKEDKAALEHIRGAAGQLLRAEKRELTEIEKHEHEA